MRKLALLAAALSIGLPMVAQSGVAQADDWSVRFSYGPQPAGWNGDYGYGHRDRLLSPQYIRDLVRQNYDQIRDIRLQGRSYVLRARNYEGRHVILVLDACSGALLESHYTDNGDWRDRDGRWDDGRSWHRPPPSYDDADWRD